MGATNYDLNEKHRQHEERFAFGTPEGVEKLLTCYHDIKERRYFGDYAACDILIDLQLAIEAAGLSDRQREALRLVYVEDLGSRRAAEAMAISQRAVNKNIGRALARLARVYRDWNYGEMEEQG
jgi:DNA-directed RNA polymerase specialized sigma24 family protein